MELALYRACRPRRFDEFLGQEHVTRTLRNALAQGRLAHAYLFCGPRGTGKTSAARVLAKALSCPNTVDGEPCGECEICVRIGAGEGLDVIEMDAASNRGIDEIRSLRERIRLAPVAGRYKVYVIDEVHMLTNEAFNALLKTLEEPPANVLFVLCTTEAYRVPATILSRCQRFDFQRLGTEPIAAHLSRIARERGLEADPAALRMIARAATGSVRDALGILDQCMAYAPAGVTEQDARRVLGAVNAAELVALADAILQGDVAASWRTLDDLLMQGRDPREIARALAGHFRDVLLFALAGREGEFTGPAADDQSVLARQGSESSEEHLYQVIEALAAVEAEMRLAAQPRLLFESRLVRLCGRAGATPAVRPQRRVPPLQGEMRQEEALPQKPPSPEAPPPGRGEPAPRAPRQEPPELARLWPQVLRDVGDIYAGWLDGAEPRWEGLSLRVFLPAGREIAATRLAGGEGQKAIARIMSGLAGRPVDISIQVRQAETGLFADGAGGGDVGSAARHGRGRGREVAPAEAPARDGAEAAPESGDSLARQAEALFRAEEVKGGPTER
ncbi:MAG: DNA polymerase III subunit gamma/tau [Bacillota bacterium]|nr:DNA polymerase III subunit gamma/tau [Bacillota bacterium]